MHFLDSLEISYCSSVLRSKGHRIGRCVSKIRDVNKLECAKNDLEGV